MQIEVTERVHDMEDLDIKHLISKLRQAGFTVAIDDFGTEYAVALLSEVNDVLKLDKSMIDNISVNPKTKAIVESFQICTKLGIIDMVAEGIETEEQANPALCGVGLAQDSCSAGLFPRMSMKNGRNL